MKILTQLTPFFKQKQITPFKGNGSDHLNPWYCIQKYGEKKGKTWGYQLIARPTFIIMSVSLQRILGHFSSSLCFIILQAPKRNLEQKIVILERQQQCSRTQLIII